MLSPILLPATKADWEGLIMSGRQVSSNPSALIKQCSQITTKSDQGGPGAEGVPREVNLPIQAQQHDIGWEHMGSTIEHLKVEEETFEDETPEKEERGGPAEELEEVVVREENPPRTVKIGSTLALEHKAAL
ncbi:hypothetical protein LWI29_011729 [Acer saccharum]|uniref:Uncharacterized protein n=1 Tax=Acer saccharum TaxID=4024 RepID=A0AA39RCV8_ACESA|nr:hypothetical protein LWI29_011729 [Acer saccharum]